MKRLFLLIPILVTLAACREKVVPPPPPPPIPTKILVPATGAYTGAYLDFGDNEDTVTLEQIEDFQTVVGKHQAIVASSSYWGEQTFPTHNLKLIAANGSIPLLYWSPWDRPYNQDQGPDKFALTTIVAGQWDAYIDSWADAAKAYQRPFFVAWGLEMNGTWFPWSGWFYGAHDSEAEAGHKIGAALYKQAYRHVVDRVRARGVSNIVWVFQTNNQSAPAKPWNTMADYYPGDDYVDWLGLSAYGIQFFDGDWITPDSAFTQAYDELCALNTTKPIMMAEWGCAEFPSVGSKAGFITDALALMETKMPRLKAAVFWNERWQNSDGTYSNLRVTSSAASVEAYRKGVATPFWLATPELK